MSSVFKLYSEDKNILVVEDSPIGQQIASAVFAGLGLEVEIADTGEKAVALVNNRHFDLVFMDLHLPHMDGNQAATAISKLQPGIPIVALTGDNQAAAQSCAATNPMKEYLTKPIDVDNLVKVLNKYIPRTSSGPSK